MMFEYSYHGHTSVDSGPHRTAMSFAPDAKREPTYFSGALAEGIAFREAISALHDVVVSDLRYRPKDREAYKAWLAEQEQGEIIEMMAQSAKLKEQARGLETELASLSREIRSRMGPFYAAQQKYFDYLYTHDYNAWFVLDPVITVHPDQIFFECFSQDESTYGRLAAKYSEFTDVGEFACGTTNVDYSAALYDEFQKIRTYKTTRFEVDPEGFDVKTTGEADYREVKIDLPDTWVRGFLQVSSAMTLPAVTFDLHPLDVFNVCFYLRRHKETHGPRSMRYILEPGKPVRILLEPWNHVIECPRSIFEGTDSHEIRVWGRRRIHVLERMLSVTKKFTVHLLGTGMPSFYVADLGTMVFTLGLSGWTANDWSKAGNFDLMAPRADVDHGTKTMVFDALKENWFEDPAALAKRLALDPATVLGALGAWTQAGRAIYDLDLGVYRVRELSREPLPMDKLRFASEQEARASALVSNGGVQITSQRQDGESVLHIHGTVRGSGRGEVSARIDADQRLVGASCPCSFYRMNKLYKGPCEHILALRIAARP